MFKSLYILLATAKVMWIVQPGLRESIKDKYGKVWHFAHWSDVKEGVDIQRLFFWDTEKESTGLVELKGDKIIHYSKWKDRALKIVNDKEYRAKFIKPLKFPLDNSQL
jgi:hypothetical protein